jgi:hypothetical protein
LDADLEPSSAKDKAQDERLGIMVHDEQIIDTPDKSS